MLQNFVESLLLNIPQRDLDEDIAENTNDPLCDNEAKGGIFGPRFRHVHNILFGGIHQREPVM